MSRRFNTAGPNDPARHHTVPALSRVPGVREIIEQGSSFILHAPKQTGKTTALLDLAAVLNREGKYVAAVLSLEPGAALTSIDAAELAMLDSWRYDLAAYLPADVSVPRWPDAPQGNRIGAALSAFSQEAPRPLVILLDGLDSLSRDVRVSLVRQIRAGKPRRPRAFPWSIGFASVREPRELDAGQAPSSSRAPASSTGLDAEVLTLQGFSRSEVATLLQGLEERTGLELLPGAVERAHELTQGHPFLVNALAQRIADGSDGRKGPLTAVDIERAKDLLLDRRGGLLDEISDRMRDGKLRAALEQILAEAQREPPAEDLRGGIDLGLVRRMPDGTIALANPIFHALVARLLPGAVRSVFPVGQPAWVGPDGRLDTDRLLEAFLDFWRRHGDALFSSAPYGELSPLVLTAFLNRVVKSGGLIERVYAIGRGRMDVCIRQGGAAVALVVKVRRDRDPDPIPEGLAQVDEALARLGIEDGWLVVFDRRKGVSPVSQRLGAAKEKTPAGREVVLVRA
ncbi:ATP-binding protein [Polyangium mundeleinium]|uniref:ATP-binding protein n=1 Tax=Polyangium mundeleinium TaxID=2995306 RepID=A0ABT5EM40_9BACT|nr:ATP-binding protein [Polyangium mundeleinium]MDC0742447.1 ATP-binding protein [Polyangium mundeleinium]